MKLQIAKDFTFPADAVTQTMAAIGRRGAGKTYLATLIAEQMLDAGAQVVAIDPIGNWWGLRVAADGKSKGKEIYVVGGDQGDIPIVSEAGARVAHLVVEKGISAVIDVSRFRIGERKRFATDFAEELLQLKKSNRSALHVFVEEAQLFVPQRFGADDTRMFSAFEQLVRLGRNYGIGSTLVSQRPQSVNWEVLSQVECLCVLQVTGPHERKALEQWVQEAGADRKLIGELPGLKQGEGFVWSPQWLRRFERVHFNTKRTFDASATPVVGRATKAAKLTAIDVEALKADMADVVQQAEEHDPKALRRRIAELERAAKTQKPDATPAESLTGVRHRAGVRATVDLYSVALKNVRADLQMLRKADEKLLIACKEAHAAIERITGVIGQFTLAEKDQQHSHMPAGPATKPVVTPQRQAAAAAAAPKRDSDAKLDRAQRALLEAIAQRDPQASSRSQIAILSGYSIKSSSFANALSALRVNGLVDGRGDQNVITDAGRQIAGHIEPKSPSEVLQWWRGKLEKADRALLDVAIEAYPASVTRPELAERSGYSLTSSSFANALSKLRTLELISGRNEIVANKDLVQ